MKITETPLPEVLLVECQRFGDSRGYLVETWHEKKYREAGLEKTFVQDNLSFSQRGVLRGLHFQNPRPQGKLVTALHGNIFDVAVDIRVGSPHFGRWFGVELSRDNQRQLYVPEGFAHGFAVLSETAMVHYKCTALYDPTGEGSLLWNDPELAIDWPVKTPELSAKDLAGLRLRDFPAGKLPAFHA